MPENQDQPQRGEVGPEDLRVLERRVAAWVSTPDGLNALIAASKEAVDFTNRVREIQRVDPKMLHEPITR